MPRFAWTRNRSHDRPSHPDVRKLLGWSGPWRRTSYHMHRSISSMYIHQRRLPGRGLLRHTCSHGTSLGRPRHPGSPEQLASGSQSNPGFITAFGVGYTPSAGFFEWLNGYSANAFINGTFRQSFLTTVGNPTPFQFNTLWECVLLANIYDSLFVQNPQCTNSASLAGSAGVPVCSSIIQNIDWMTTSHSFLCYPGGPGCTSTTLGYGNATYFANTVADLRLSLNRANHWHDSGPVTAWDVKYSFIDLNATGAFQATSLSNVAHVNVLDEFTVDLNLKAKGPFTELFLGGITIMPGHVWSGC